MPFSRLLILLMLSFLISHMQVQECSSPRVVLIQTIGEKIYRSHDSCSCSCHAVRVWEKFVVLSLFCCQCHFENLSILQQTALHWSAYYNNPEHVKLLIKHDSNIGIPDVEGKIPLHWAANHKDPSAVHTVRCILVGIMDGLTPQKKLCYELSTVCKSIL